MRTMKRKAVAIMTALLAVCTVSLTGCQEKLAPADQVVSALYELSVKDNAAPITELLGYESEDNARNSLMETGTATMLDQLVDELGGIEFDEQELQEMGDTLDAMASKLSCTAEITDQSSKETTVVLKVKSFSYSDMEAIMTEVQNELLESVDEETAMAIYNGDQEAANQLIRDVVKECMNRFASLEPVAEESEITVKCEKLRVDVNGKEKISWMPSDMAKFSTDTAELTFK